MQGQRELVSTRRLGFVLSGALATWAAGSSALLLAARSSASDLTAPGLLGLEGQLATAAGVLGVVLLSWLTVLFVASVLDLTSPDSHRMPPGVALEAVRLWRWVGSGGACLQRDHGSRVVRRVAALVLGLSVAAVTAAPAQAAIPASSSTSAASAAAMEPLSVADSVTVVDSVTVTDSVTDSVTATDSVEAAQPVAAVLPGNDWPAQESATWTPDRPAVSIARAVQPDIGLVTAAPRLGAAIIEEVAVRRGDTLWSIAARHLGPDVRADDVARAWPLWWQANRSVIGEDPDLILPGQILHAPSGTPE